MEGWRERERERVERKIVRGKKGAWEGGRKSRVSQ